MSRLLVVGEAAFDRLHLADRTVESVGGAGMYTAMAARRYGALVVLFGLRPDPCPESLQPVVGRLSGWLGPAVPPEQLPRFEISYRGGNTEYLAASRGAEPTLSPAMLPADLSGFDLLHVAPKASLEQQLAFVDACRQRGGARISAGTDLSQTLAQPGAVREVFAHCDYFFMNEVEAGAVFGSLESARVEAGQVLFITQGARGVRIVQGQTAVSVPAVRAQVVDPTGAGDTFCGATLASLLQQSDPVTAARQGVALAAKKIGWLGPAALLSDEPPPRA
jgi:sugar/nucleoside kinase (ribokinase family)